MYILVGDFINHDSCVIVSGTQSVNVSQSAVCFFKAYMYIHTYVCRHENCSDKNGREINLASCSIQYYNILYVCDLAMWSHKVLLLFQLYCANYKFYLLIT